jgi:hypothetical protein
MISMTAMYWQYPKPYLKAIVTYMQKLPEPTTDTKTMQTNILYHPQTTNQGILSGLMSGTRRLIAHYKNLITNNIAHLRY